MLLPHGHAGGGTSDIYIDTRALHKGELWVNGHALGRFWSVGPQFALHTPAPWLLSGSNDLVFFDLKGDRQEALKTGLEPIYAMPVASEAR